MIKITSFPKLAWTEIHNKPTKVKLTRESFGGYEFSLENKQGGWDEPRLAIPIPDYNLFESEVSLLQEMIAKHVEKIGMLRIQEANLLDEVREFKKLLDLARRKND